MRYTEIFALAVGNVGATQFSITRLTDTTTSANEISTTTIGTGALNTAGGIGTPDGFNFLGCFSSEDGFPGFTQAYSSVDNDADLCAETCLGANFFGLYDNKCYCGSELDPITSPSVITDQCDIACPGDADVSCGGLAADSRVIRRQEDLSVLLSIYIAIGVKPGEPNTVVNTDFVTKT